MMTTRCMQECDMNSLVDYFNAIVHGIWEGIVTTRREISIEHICCRIERICLKGTRVTWLQFV